MSDEVKRWEIHPMDWAKATIREKPDGFWVAAQDHDSIMARLAEELARLNALLTKLRADFVACDIENGRLAAELTAQLAEAKRCLDGGFDCASERMALQAQAARLKSEIDFLDGELKRLTAELDVCRKGYNSMNARIYGPGGECFELDRVTAELSETQLLTTRDDYAALERICNEMARDMDALRGELAEAKAESDKWERLCKAMCDELDAECGPDCDSYSHAENCAAISHVALFRKLKAQVSGLREALEQEREMYRRAKHPDPFKIGIVYTQRDGIRYLLPIVRQWNEYPDVALEVEWCAALAGPTRTADQTTEGQGK
jgi:hypothetical protein